MASMRLSVRLSASQAAILDDLAATLGCDRSTALRRLLDEAASGSHGGQPARLSQGDLLDLLEERARAGSAPAIRALLERAEGDAEVARLNALTTGEAA